MKRFVTWLLIAVLMVPFAPQRAYSTDLSVTVGSVAKGSDAAVANGTAGVTITAGQAVYLEAATATYKLADTNSATAEVRNFAGIALHASLAGQPIQVQTGGSITIGATLTVGEVYVLSANAGGIAPIADLVAGHYTCIIGVATSATVLKINIFYPAVLHG